MPVSLAGGWGRSRGLGQLAGKWRWRRGGGRTEWRRQNKGRQPEGRRRLGSCRRCRRFRRCRQFRRCRRRSGCWRCRSRHRDSGWWLLQPAARHPGVVRVGHEARRHHLDRRCIVGRWRGSGRVLVVVVNPPHHRERNDQHHGGRADTPAEQLARPSAVGYPATAADLL
jgi:hypothetical protein